MGKLRPDNFREGALLGLKSLDLRPKGGHEAASFHRANPRHKG
jgi:hypothetical protein